MRFGDWLADYFPAWNAPSFALTACAAFSGIAQLLLSIVQLPAQFLDSRAVRKEPLLFGDLRVARVAEADNSTFCKGRCPSLLAASSARTTCKAI